MRAYPNPVRDRLTVEGGEGTQATLLTVDGRVLRSMALQSAREVLDVTTLPNGVYFLRVNRTGKEEVIRLAVQH